MDLKLDGPEVRSNQIVNGPASYIYAINIIYVFTVANLQYMVYNVMVFDSASMAIYIKLPTLYSLFNEKMVETRLLNANKQ